jgi:hypothetical protein
VKEQMFLDVSDYFLRYPTTILNTSAISLKESLTNQVLTALFHAYILTVPRMELGSAN